MDLQKKLDFLEALQKICELIRHSEPEVEYFWLSDGLNQEIHHEETIKTG